MKYPTNEKIVELAYTKQYLDTPDIMYLFDAAASFARRKKDEVKQYITEKGKKVRPGRYIPLDWAYECWELDVVKAEKSLRLGQKININRDKENSAISERT